MSIVGGDADWRDERAYDYTARLARRGWAWEFLRRNNEFQRDHGIALEQAKYLKNRAQFEVIKSPVDLTKWGVMFRGFMQSRCGCLLVPAAMLLRAAY